jgi:hypothetical protein
MSVILVSRATTFIRSLSPAADWTLAAGKLETRKGRRDCILLACGSLVQVMRHRSIATDDGRSPWIRSAEVPAASSRAGGATPEPLVGFALVRRYGGSRKGRDRRGGAGGRRLG